MRSIHTVEIKDEGAIGAARRAVHEFAGAANFAETELAEIDIVVQEIGTNAVRYASSGGGELHFTQLAETETSGSVFPLPDTLPHGRVSALSSFKGIEIFYWDKGPGILDTEAAMRDSYSTGGGLGGGFGAIRRLTDEVDIYSTAQGLTGRLTPATARRTTHGTALLCRKQTKTKRMPTANDDTEAMESPHRIGAWTRPRAGEDANGDAYFVSERGTDTLLAVIDGLGHGPGAREAARTALEVLSEWGDESPGELIHATHAALRSTRGAVAGLVRIDRAREQMQYAGVGNTTIRVSNAPQPTHPVSANGTLGARLGRVPVWSYAWSPETMIVMTTDGVSSKWDMAAYPGLPKKQAQMIAGVLMRDYGRTSDDATILVAR